MTIGSWLRAAPLTAADFPPGTPLHHFCAWNEAARRQDRRYIIAGDLGTLLAGFGGGEQARAICVTHLARRPLILARLGGRVLLSRQAALPAGSDYGRADDGRGGEGRPAVTAARDLVARLLAAIGSGEEAAHAAVFEAFEALAAEIDLAALAALARVSPRLARAKRPAGPRRILIVRLSAFGDFVQSLGPIAAIRRHHAAAHIVLLTTVPFAAFARELGYFDEVLIDPRPKPSAFKEWWALRRHLRQGRFDRVYDLQTSQRSGSYLRLFGRGNRPEWSGIAAGCSHPHANLDRDRQHTIDKQAEQLLMAGIHPTPLPALPPGFRQLPGDLAGELAGRDFVTLVPGCSPRHLAKRWPAARYGRLAQALHRAGYLPVVVGTPQERALAAEIGEACPETVDLVGRTDLGALAAIAGRTRLTIGNDTGVCHLAAAGGNPVVVLFSAASDPALCAPRGRHVRIIAVPELGERGDLSVDAVFAEAMAALRQPYPAEPAPA